MQLINYLETKIVKIDSRFVYLEIEENEIIKWPKNKISDLEIYEGKNLKLIIGGDNILEDQKNILLKKIVKEIVNDTEQN